MPKVMFRNECRILIQIKGSFVLCIEKLIIKTNKILISKKK